MTTVVDSPQRIRALDAEQSFICEAPAGSGKTELLTQRLLTLLSRVSQPEEILAITFTRKAAGEMRARLVRALENAAKHPEPESEHERLTWRLARAALAADARLSWNLIHYPSRLQIKTFDSLCASLANTLPWHSSFATPPAVTEDAEEIYLAAVRELLASLEGEGPWVEALATVLELLDNNCFRLESLLVNMLGKRDAWLPVIGRNAEQQSVRDILEANLRRTRDETCEQLRAAIAWPILETLLQLAAFAAANLAREEAESPLLVFFDFDLMLEDEGEAISLSVEQWQALAGLLLTKAGTWRKTINKRDGFPTSTDKSEKLVFKEKKDRLMSIVGELSENEYLHGLLTELINLPSDHYSEDQQRLLAAVTQVLPACAAFLIAEFQTQNCVDFTEVSLRASQALGDLESPTDLALALDYKIQHILVDEFQDTSPSQIELLKRLTAGWQPGDGRTMFCVGDAMQSIYGFRNANVGLFLKCLEDGLGDLALEPLRLSTNFRSQENLVAWTNDTFRRAFPAQNDIAIGAVSYANSIAFGAALEGDAVQVHGIYPEHYAGDEAEKVLALIQARRAQNPEASIAILVRNRGVIRHLTPCLQNAGLNYRAVDLEQLSEHMEIQDLMALSHAMLRPADTIAWLSVLRAPWCGLKLRDLESIVTIAAQKHLPFTVLQKMLILLTDINEEISDVKYSPSNPLSEDGKNRLARVAPILYQAQKNTQRKSLRQWIEGTWIELGGPACLTEQAQFKNCELFFDLLEKLDSSTLLKSRDALEKAVAKLFAAPDPKSDDKLQIMTIHKSKGLEFDTVILPSLHRIGRSSESELLRWYERITAHGDTQLIMSPITSSGKEKDPVYAHVAFQEKRREANESCRLLYVACTRAKNYLHLITQVQPSEQGSESQANLKAPPKNALISTIWDSVKNRLVLSPQAKANSAEDKKTAEEVLAGEIEHAKVFRRLSSNWALPALPQGDLLSAYIPYFEHFNRKPPDTGWPDDTLRLVGTVIHRLLQDLSLTRLDQWQAAFAAQAQAGIDQNHLRFWRSLLINSAVESSKLEAALERMAKILRAVANNTQLREIFSTPPHSRRMELAISAAKAHTQTQAVVSDENLDSEDKALAARQFVIDLLWLRSEEEIWIVDYKTGEPHEGEDAQNFFQRELANYENIMGQYRDTVTAILQNTQVQAQIRLFLYFPLLDEWVEYGQAK